MGTMIRVACVAVAVSLLTARACAQAQVSGTVETYFLQTDPSQGFIQSMTWAEVHVRWDHHWKFTGSYTIMPTRRNFDEMCLTYEDKFGLVRVGRIRIPFGFSDWSDYFYNGFNHIPAVRLNGLVDGQRLTGADTGVEFTTGGPDLQVQASLVDTKPSRFQVGPTQIRSGSLRLQRDFGDFILGLDYLQSLSQADRIYGLDFRWSSPHWMVRGELTKGDGGDTNSSGYYVDAEYRLPKLPRTQAVARSEALWQPTATYNLYTVGARQMFPPYVCLNVNYGWGDGPNIDRFGSGMPRGWSTRAMFQVSF